MATSILLYLLKANVVLALFVAAYYGLLRRLTFFGLNRAYLLLALLFAAVYPVLPVPALLPPSAVAAALALPLPEAGPALAGSGAASAPGFDWLGWALGGYAVGTGLLLLRLLAQLLSLASMRRRARPAVVLGQPVWVLAGAGGAFSFGRSIYLSDATLADDANLLAALHHEQAHVRQWHTLDVVVTQLALALAWVNPAAWLLRRAVLDNLEYLADRAALHTGLDRRAYQYSLLHQQPGGVPAPALAFHFSFLTLKNRIAMLNQPISTTRQLGRYLLAAPLVLGLTFACSLAQAQVVPTPAPAEKPLPKNVVYYLDSQKVDQDAVFKVKSEDISYIQMLNGTQQQQIFGTSNAGGTAVVTTKANADLPAVQALNKRIWAMAPLVPATAEQTAATEAIKTYVSKNYPTAKLQSVGPAKGQADRYQAVFVEAGKRLQLFFDANGQPVQQ